MGCLWFLHLPYRAPVVRTFFRFGGTGVSAMTSGSRKIHENISCRFGEELVAVVISRGKPFPIKWSDIRILVSESESSAVWSLFVKLVHAGTISQLIGMIRAMNDACTHFIGCFMVDVPRRIPNPFGLQRPGRSALVDRRLRRSSGPDAWDGRRLRGAHRGRRSSLGPQTALGDDRKVSRPCILRLIDAKRGENMDSRTRSMHGDVDGDDGLEFG